MKVTILGAGHGGQAMAADLTLGGHEVCLAAVPVQWPMAEIIGRQAGPPKNWD